jgi:hypothetical protein
MEAVVVVNDLEVIEAMSELATVRSDKKVLSSRERKLREKVLNTIGETSQTIATPSGLIIGSVVVYEQRKMDWEMLEKAFPEAYAACVSAEAVVRLDTAK